LKSLNAIVPYQYLIDVAERVGALLKFSYHKYTSFVTPSAWGYNYFFVSPNYINSTSPALLRTAKCLKRLALRSYAPSHEG
jgi:hypothetical protein